MIGLPILTSRVLIAALLKAGFRIVRQVGSHVRLQHIADASRKVTVPQHNLDIPRWLLKSILRQSRASLGELFKLLGK